MIRRNSLLQRHITVHRRLLLICSSHPSVIN
jgi:hypothetical protein